MKENLPDRKHIRHKHFDYNDGIIFLTICTKDRRCVLSRIVGTDVLDGPKIELLPHGKIADKFINELDEFYENISVLKYVIMPNHIHLLLQIRNADRRGRRSLHKCEQLSSADVEAGHLQKSALSKFCSTFKRFCNKEFGENIWQRGSYDHVIRSDLDLDRHIEYIQSNPLNWYYDELFIEQ